MRMRITPMRSERKCPHCDYVASSYTEWRDHLREVHNIA